MGMKTTIETGTKITNDKDFVTPIGCFFRAGTTFTVVLGGPVAGRSIKCVEERTGSVVWVVDGRFLTAD